MLGCRGIIISCTDNFASMFDKLVCRTTGIPHIVRLNKSHWSGSTHLYLYIRANWLLVRDQADNGTAPKNTGSKKEVKKLVSVTTRLKVL
jgi:hypothetical protein